MARPPIEQMLTTSAVELGIEDDDVTAAAVRLVAAAHATRDASTWGGLTYWDQLAARVLLGTYRADDVAGWWEQMCRAMGCGQPTKAEDREMLARALSAPSGPVMEALGERTEALCLRVRLAWDHSPKQEQASDTQEAMW